MLLGNLCLRNQFQCSNQKCVSKTAICNGIDECGDLSDEKENCSCKFNYKSLMRIFCGITWMPKVKATIVICKITLYVFFFKMTAYGMNGKSKIATAKIIRGN